MAKIARLPSALANQIAAGEVVERPASVVKELIENAIDAGARRIEIVVEMGGKRLMRVEDDGEGMDADDARLAIERHATSKIARAEDLGAIGTLGFRGEALPSIGSVSRLMIRTRPVGSHTATEVRVVAGALESVREVAGPPGTAIEVAELFHNVPARRKFLKSDSAESAHITRLVTQFALGYPEVGFTLTSAARRVLQYPPTTALSDRFFQVFGERPDLVHMRKEVEGIKVSGYVAALTEQGAVRGAQHVFVNRRIVKDRTITHAIVQAYADATIQERSPEVHLFVEIPPERVDVNVHPTKAEVRFLEQSLVHEVLRRAIADVIGRSAPPSLQLRPDPLRPEAGGFAQGIPGIWGSPVYPGRWGAQPGDTSMAAPSAATAVVEPTIGSPAPVSANPLVPLGQFRDTFIIAVDEESISIIDQHVAHERVLFEQVMERLTGGRLEQQRLLVPVVIDVSASQGELLESHRDDLERLGFDVESFSGGSLRIAAVPALLGLEAAAATVRALAEDLEGLDRGSPAEAALRRIAATIACHAAVKANDPLTLEKMRFILTELARTAYSSVCPHGRPVVLRLSRREVEKNFHRI